MATRMIVKRTFLDFTDVDEEQAEINAYTLRRSFSDPALSCWREEEHQQSDAETETAASGGWKDGWSTDLESSDGENSAHPLAPADGAISSPLCSGQVLGGATLALGPESQQWNIALMEWPDQEQQQQQQSIIVLDASYGAELWGAAATSWEPWMWDDCGTLGQHVHFPFQEAWPCEEEPQQQAPPHCSRRRLSAKVRMGPSRRGGKVDTSKLAKASASCHPTPPKEKWTTVMLRNLPNNYSRDMLLELMDAQGFRGLYDFVYLPIDFSTCSNIGYAFVNLTDVASARRFWQVFEGFGEWAIPSRKVCILSWSDPCQGLQANVERYRNSPVMCNTVPGEYKPAVFSQGVQVDFPAPLKKLRPPRMRKGVARALAEQAPGMNPEGDSCASGPAPLQPAGVWHSAAAQDPAL